MSAYIPNSIWEYKSTNAFIEIIEIRTNTHIIFKNCKHLSHQVISIELWERLVNSDAMILVEPKKTKMFELIYI